MKSPAFPLYAQDFLLGTMFMDFADIGRYIKLLAFQWDKLKIPKNKLGLLVGLYWDDFSPDLREKFIEKDDFIFNERLEEIREQKNKFHDKQSVNGLKGGRPKANNNPNKTQTITQNQTQKNPLEEEEEIEKEIEENDLPFKEEVVHRNDPKSLNWRENFELYKQSLSSAFQELTNDTEFILQQEELNPRVDIRLSLKKSVVNFWGTQAGWLTMKTKPYEMIDWVVTLSNSISQPTNKVYKQNGTQTAFGPSAGQNPKLAGNYRAAEELAREITEKSRGFVSPMLDPS